MSGSPLNKTSYFRAYYVAFDLGLVWKILWRSAAVGQDFNPETRLFEAMVGMVDKMENQVNQVYWLSTAFESN